MEDLSNGVLIAIDWENIRRGAQLYQKIITPQSAYDAMANVGKVFGEVLGGKAFGDWRLRPDDGPAFTQAGITLFQAPRTIAGKDRSDPAILLEVYDWLRDRDDCRVVILGSGDSDYQVLVDRARGMDKRVILCAFSQSVARDMLAAAPLFPLEAELGIQLAEHGDVDVQLPTVEEQAEAVLDVLQIFVREMNQMEYRMNFVGHGMLCSQWMLDWGIAWNEHECRRLVDDWLNQGVIERHDVPNPNNPQYPTPAVRLNKTNELVRDALGLNRPAVSNPVVSPADGQHYHNPE